MIVDSSLWLEYFAGTIKGTPVSGIIKDTNSLYVPTICLYEVYKKLLIEKDEAAAMLAIAHMQQGKVVDLNIELALFAAKLSREYKLPMADSIIYATARNYNCFLWTQDQHFKGLDLVKYLKKPKPQVR
ncbi:type II toxin-antitoxin system VapC family toxin [Treponema primitia]|uniref:type II toxin-antitoxin system VapC family toxin n=1 Tax=Treponema primitia TaxID=88058 RepID=UPI0039818FA3